MINYPIYVDVYPNDCDCYESFVIKINNYSEHKMFLLLGDCDLNLFTWGRREMPKIWSTDDINLPQGQVFARAQIFSKVN